MTLHDQNKVWRKLELDGVDKVRLKLFSGAYASHKVRIVEEWLQLKEREQNAPTYMYHEIDAPLGKVFKAQEVPKLIKKGWVDTPGKFGKGFRIWRHRAPRILKNFWLEHWKFIISSIIAVVGIWVAYIKV